MPMSEKRFVFNDQNQKNSYGFRILTSGISLGRFANNPVMLDQHWNSTSAVLGKWKDWQVEGALLTGLPVFDTALEKAAEVSGQVDREFIKSCSMGITFKHEDFEWIDDELVLTKCELYEVSIVAVPSNANSIRLYADNGQVLTDDEVQKLCLSFSPENKEQEINIIKPTTTMSKIILTAGALLALGLDNKVTEHETAVVEAAVLKLSNENATLKADKLKFEAQEEQRQELAVTGLVELAIKEGRIAATKKDDFVALAKQNFDLAKATLESIPAKVSLAGMISNPSGSGAGEVKSLEDFLKLSHQEQLDFKANKPEEYKKITT